LSARAQDGFVGQAFVLPKIEPAQADRPPELLGLAGVLEEALGLADERCQVAGAPAPNRVRASAKSRPAFIVPG
jgi:hypothetical protein